MVLGRCGRVLGIPFWVFCFGYSVLGILFWVFRFGIVIMTMSLFCSLMIWFHISPIAGLGRGIAAL